MHPYQERIVAEKADLDQKIRKLSDFIMSDKFTAVNKAELNRMHQQLRAMLTYSEILGERINAF